MNDNITQKSINILMPNECRLFALCWGCCVPDAAELGYTGTKNAKSTRSICLCVRLYVRFDSLDDRQQKARRASVINNTYNYYIVDVVDTANSELHWREQIWVASNLLGLQQKKIKMKTQKQKCYYFRTELV